MYCHIALPLHIQITKTRNYQLPTKLPPGFPLLCKRHPPQVSRHPGVMSQIIADFPLQLPLPPGPPLDAAVVCPCVVLSFSISWATFQPNGSSTVVQGPLGILESRSGCRGPISLSLTSVQWSFQRPHVV